MESKNSKYSEDKTGIIIGIIIVSIIFIVGYMNVYSQNNKDDIVNPSQQNSSQTPTNTQSVSTPVPTTTPTYRGYTCTSDCSGHEAGYEYAKDNDYTQDDVDSYDGNSESFREGMQSWVDENN